MTANIITLVKHDLAIAFKNKTFILLLCIPLFVYGMMSFVDRKDAPVSTIKLAVAENARPDQAITAAIRSVPDLFSLREVPTAAEGRLLLKNRRIDGLLTPTGSDGSRVILEVLKKNSPTTLVITQAFLSLQIAIAGNGSSWITDIASIQSAAAELQALPTWILMVTLLVAFFILPAQVAEEKEKQWLSGLLQTPMSEIEWLAAKLIFSAILTFATVLALQLLGRQFILPWTYYLTLLLGTFCFNAVGLALGVLCANQSAARTFGVILYLPLMIPVALADVSAQFRKISQWTPSFALYEPLQTILLNAGNRDLFPWAWLFLLGVGSAAGLLSFRLIRVRWLMR